MMMMMLMMMMMMMMMMRMQDKASLPTLGGHGHLNLQLAEADLNTSILNTLNTTLTLNIKIHNY